MIPTFNVCQTGNCKIVITDTSIEHNLYLAEDSEVQPYDKFKFSDTGTVNIIELLNSDNSSEVVKIDYVDHSSYLDETHYALDGDGYYLITHIILPTVDWAYKIQEQDPDFLSYYDAVYAIEDNQIYKWTGEVFTECDVEELLRNEYKTTICKDEKKTFSICALWKCYIEAAKALLNSNINKCKKNTDLETLEFNRDFVWMTINVLTYYIEKGDLEAAQVLYDRVKGCNGVCQDSSRIIKKGAGCGCKN